MALKKQSLLTQKDLVQSPRLSPDQNGGSKRLRMASAAGAELLPVGCPVAFNSSSNLWVPYTQPSDPAEYTLTRDAGGGDGGTFQLSIDGAMVIMDWDEDTAGVLAKVNAVLTGAGLGYQVTVANSGSGTDLGTSANVQTITFAEAAGAPNVTFNGENLNDGAVIEATGIVLAAVDAGTALNGTNEIRGFVLEANSADTDSSGNEGVKLDVSDDVLAMGLHKGVVYRDDINTAAIRLILANFGAPSEAELDAALRAPELRDRGIVVRGLVQVP